MAVKSMTGFGRGESCIEKRRWAVEIRCVNHRYLDLKCKLPRGYGAIEDLIRKKIENCHHRGRVDLVLTVSGDFTDLVRVRTNIELASIYKKALEEMGRGLELDTQVDLRTLINFPDVLVTEQDAENLEESWPVIENAIDAALKSCSEMRLQEGATLVRDLISRLDHFNDVVNQVESSIPQLLSQREETLKGRLEKLLGSVQLDPLRLAQEVAVMADKTDVTEEIVRLKSHMTQFRAFLDDGSDIGRKMDFLIQEFLREVNTLASKINDASIAHLTVELKGELEKMREQVQNIE